MIALSRAPVLVASASTFSMWASHLGRMPVVWFPGQLRQPLYSDDLDADVDRDEGEALPAAFVRAVRWDRAESAPLPLSEWP